MTPNPAIDLLAKLVAFDTTSSNSNLELISFIQDYLADHGIDSQRIPSPEGDKANLWATIGPDIAGGTILSGHTDTVPVDGQDWRTDPFTLTQRGDRLYARGACDMKGFLACVLAAVPRMIRADLARPIHLAFSYDEEIGCVGVIGLIDWLAGQPTRPAFCVVGEPTMMAVGLGHKAKRSIRITVSGRSCHSALAPQGVNAVEYGALMVAKIHAMGARMATAGARDPAYDIAHSTAHTGIFHGGTALNIVPDKAVIDCEFRVLPGEDSDALVDELRAYADKLQNAMRQRHPESGIEITTHAEFPGLDTAADAEIAGLGLRFADSNQTIKVAYGTEGGRFASAPLTLPTIVCGPGSITQAHQPDEFIAVQQLERCDQFLDRLIAWSSRRDDA